jgi:hypothetical protein
MISLKYYIFQLRIIKIKILDKYKYMDIIYVTLLVREEQISVSLGFFSSARASFLPGVLFLKLKKIIAGKNNGTEGRRE